MLAGSVALVLVAYLAGVRRLWRKSGRPIGIRPLEVAAFVSGSVALAVALSPPLDEWSEAWFSAHMVQHELLMVVAAPLMALGSPLAGLLYALPSHWRRRVTPIVHRRPLPTIWAAATAPPVVFVLYGTALWVWHLPALYDAALEHEAVHFVQHFCFFGTAALFWWGIAHSRHGRIGYGAAVVYVFATAVHGSVLGALLTVSPRVWYVPYSSSHAHGLTPLEDQQLAGLLMWIPAGLAFAAGGLLLFAAWLKQSDRRAATAVARTRSVGEAR